MIKSFNTSLLALALAATGLMAAAPCSAQTSDGSAKVTVSYADLDLSRAAGREVLAQRIDRAAIKVCGPQPNHRVFSESADFGKCRAAAVDSARPQIESAQLSATTRVAAR